MSFGLTGFDTAVSCGWKPLTFGALAKIARHDVMNVAMAHVRSEGGDFIHRK